MARRIALALLVSAVLLAVCPGADAARRLLQNSNEAIVGARMIKPARSTSTVTRSALTPEAAEATANSAFGGVHRLTAPPAKRSYATVDAHSTDINNNNRAITPRARSAQDITRGGPNRGNGHSSMPALVMGGMAKATTYEGATSISTTDSLGMNAGRRSSVSSTILTARGGVLRGATRSASYGVTSNNPILSNAMSGAANNHIVLAQANEAVSMAQTERA
ncbi:hypothetical protein HT031_005861 [Scenedesmus sp. PABB004]|nr:hypothetical protein HT031_005861 [Scenedesmus sp. PABB004]